MKILKLTKFLGEAIYVNFDKVESFYTHEGRTYIDFQQFPESEYHFCTLIVEETSEQVYEMLMELKK